MEAKTLVFALRFYPAATGKPFEGYAETSLGLEPFCVACTSGTAHF